MFTLQRYHFAFDDFSGIARNHGLENDYKNRRVHKQLPLSWLMDVAWKRYTC